MKSKTLNDVNNWPSFEFISLFNADWTSYVGIDFLNKMSKMVKFRQNKAIRCGASFQLVIFGLFCDTRAIL